jgi:nucleotide sugar dehydrogenase
MEGKAIEDEQTLPKIIGAYNDAGFDLAREIFESIGTGKIIRVKNPKTAEFCKLTDNSYRSTNFAFANDLAICAANNDIDVHEVIGAANFGYQRNSIANPGFVSGYCLGKDPYIFEHSFTGNKFLDTRSLWYYGRRANDLLIDYILNKLYFETGVLGLDLKKSKIAILGLAFKENVDDFRMSHAFEIIRKLNADGIYNIVGYDPYLNKSKYTEIPLKNEYDKIVWVDMLKESDFKDVRTIIIAHKHRELMEMSDAAIANLLPDSSKPVFIFDAWNIWRHRSFQPQVKYMSLGFNG